jgi:hypothetical protein
VLIMNTVSQEFRFLLDVRDGDCGAHNCADQ